jgi:hypothetical protein
VSHNIGSLALQARRGSPPDVWMQLPGFIRPIDLDDLETSSDWSDAVLTEESDASDADD